MPGATFEMPDAYAASAVIVSDGVMTADGSNPYILTSATAAFTTADAGKKIVVAGAGAAAADLTTTIKQYISATKVLLDDPALTTVASADISYVKGVYRLSELIALGDVDGNQYEVLHARRINIQVGAGSPGGILYIGGPYVTPTNAGMELNGGQSDNFSPGGVNIAAATSDYLTSDMAAQLVNIYWVDDYNLSSPA